MKKIILLFILPFLLSCSRSSFLTVQTQYLSKETLASYYVGSPDPMQVYPPIGQKLYISWNLPTKCVHTKEARLEIKVRLRNQKQILLSQEIEKSSGTTIYQIEGEDYIESKGILTYKVDLIIDGQVVEEWKHQLWHELITVGNQAE